MESSDEDRGMSEQPLLIIFGGLPGTGKSTLARELAQRCGATYLRIDSIEQALREAAATGQPIEEEGYCVAFAVAEDNLRLGRTVIADCVNPVRQSRDAWLAVAQRAHARAAEVEVVCSDLRLHRQRVETRTADIPGLKLPAWEQVTGRDYEPWERAHVVIDTARRSLAESVEELQHALRG
jgi:predicted kinase